MADDHRRRRCALEDLVERRLGGVGEVDDGPAGSQLVHEGATGVGQALVRSVQAGGEGVRNVVGEPDHADAGVPEVREGRRIVTERLRALHREEEPDAAVRSGKILAAPHVKDVVTVLVEQAAEGFEEPVRSGASLVHGPVSGVERADLQRDVPRPQLRQPVRRERVRLVPAEDELEQEIVVGVGDHRLWKYSDRGT